MDSLKKTVCVTGASKGIGRAIALAFCEQGADVIINYNHSETDARSLQEEAATLGRGGRIEIFQADVSKEDEVKKLFNFIKKEFKKLDVLVNNAGITRDKYMMMSKSDDWKQVLAVNLDSIYYCSKAAAWLMLNRKSGSIVNVSSVSGVMGAVGQTAYSASKAGIIGFTRSLAKELGPYNITVNSVAPGYIETDMVKKLGEKQIEAYLKSIPLGRLGKPSDIAELVLFLSAGSKGYITGQTIVIDGGLSA